MKPTITNEELRLFVGKKADYYLKQFENIQDKQPVAKMNLPALFISIFWLFYRKMYLIGILLFLAVVVETTISNFIFINLLGYASSPKMYNGMKTFLYPAICAALANRWYLFHAKKKIEKIKQSILSEDSKPAAIKKEGGTSIVSGIFAPILLFFVAFVILVIIEMVKKGKI